VALAKFLSNKRAPGVIVRGDGGLGGMGYVEDTPLPLLYREAPLNGIWEGSGNVICLDILRTLERDPRRRRRLPPISTRPGPTGAMMRRWRRSARAGPAVPDEAEARWFAERTALLLTASVLIRQGARPVADAFVATRLR
jgi:putative acyl-CoA dehydrogenase